MIFLKKTLAGIENTDEAAAEYALVPIKEYHGYENALRILREKSLLNADKAKADEHGFTMKTAIRMNKREYGCNVWKVTTETPYALKIGLESAAFFIEKDLRLFYGMPDPEEFTENKEYFVKTYAHMFTPEKRDSWERIRASKETYETWAADAPSDDTLRQLADLNALLSLHEKYHDRIILEIDSFAANYGSGRFQVSYYATALTENA